MNPATREDLRVFFNLKSTRGVPPVLKRLGVPCRGRLVPWPAVLLGLGLAPEQSPQKTAELTSPLMTTPEVAAIFGVDRETIDRWKRANTAGMPQPIQLGKDRLTRWRRAEIRAWSMGQPLPSYAPAPVRRAAFGALATTRAPRSEGRPDREKALKTRHRKVAAGDRNTPALSPAGMSEVSLSGPRFGDETADKTGT